jgi:hypothetical protein
MKLFAALLLSALLAGAAYAAFWWACLAYTTNEMRGAVEQVLGGTLTYGTPRWVPDVRQVAMALPGFKLTIPDGPIREIRANEVNLESGFLVRDRWSLKLPPHVEVQLANGKVLLLETEKGEVVWLGQENNLSLRADTFRLMNLTGSELGRVSEVMVERRPTDAGIRINLASRPEWNGKPALLSGQVVLPQTALGQVLNLFGQDQLPGFGQILTAVEKDLQSRGGSLELKDVSFKTDTQSGALYGTLNVAPDGITRGELIVTADTPSRLEGWIEQANLVKPRSTNEQIGWRRAQAAMNNDDPTMRLEVMQNTLLMNGFPVGPLPNAADVVGRLWTR